MSRASTWRTLGLGFAMALTLGFGGAAGVAHAQSAVDATPAPKTEAAAPGTAEREDYALKMRALEEKVSDLKEKIFRSKARLMLLRETVLSGAIAGAKALIVHQNEMGASFVLESAAYSLDGAPILNRTDTNGDLADKESIELFSGNIVPGNHNISVNLVYRGSGFGVFNYLKGYRFKIQSSFAFTAEEGKMTTIRVVAFEKGDFTTDMRDRPDVRYEVDVKQDEPTQAKPSGTTPEAAGVSSAPGA